VRFDAQLARNVEAANEVVSRAASLLGGRSQMIVELKSTEPSTGLVLTSRLLPDGTLLEGSLGGQMRLAREEEAVARDPAREQLDLYARSTVPASGSLPRDPRQLSRVTYRVCGADPSRLAGPWQTVEAVDGDCARVRVERAGPSDRRDLSDAERSRWLASDARVTASDPEVKKAARAAAGKARPVDLPVLVRWVHDHVRYALDFNPFNASQVLAEGRGDCSEGALLLVAMARALGLPAREVYGLVLASTEPLGFGYHAWAEVAVGDRWLPVDPTWNEAPTNPTHLRFEGEGPYGVLSVFGRVTLGVLEAE
jgi:transglutaminase-like putative cysteine protease